MTTLASLVARLQADVPAENSVPSSAQYEQAVKDAVADFSRRCGLVKIGTLSIEAGTATYTLEDDYLQMIELLTINYSGTLVTSEGLIPIDPSFTSEKYTIANKQITFYPTPGYSMDRDYRYKAAWILNGGDYTSLGDNEASIVMMKAQAIALSKQVNVASAGALSYSFGALSVDKGSGVENKQSRIGAFENDYLAAVDSYNGRVILIG